MPPAIQAIVCAVDFSAFSPLVIRYGVVLARRAGVRLHLIHAVHDPQDRLHPTVEFERGGDLTHMADEARQRFRELMAAAPVAWEAVVRVGDPVEQTVAFANDMGPSLVISASHGVSGFRRLFIGTVVERLTRAMDHPMLVVKPTDRGHGDPFTGFGCLAVSCDGRGHWQRLGTLLPLLDPDSTARIHLVHAMEGPLAQPMVASDGASYSEIQETHGLRIRHHLDHQAHRLFAPGHTHSVSVAPGIPEEMALRVAKANSADLIVVGVRRSGKVGRWISGSTTEGLLRRASCCVLTLPEPMDADASAGEGR